MKLTTQQIATIEETLVLNGVVYDDIKLELLDHIATEIELEISIEEKPFEVVLKEVFERWKRSLVITSSSAWLGVFFQAPRVVVDKMISYSKRQIVFVLMSTIIFGFFLALIVSNIHQEQTFNALNWGLRGGFLLMVLATIASLFLIWKSKIKTTYGRLFLYRGWLTFLFIFQFNLINGPLRHFNVNNSLWHNFISCFFIGFPFFYSFFQIMMAFEHFKTAKKLKLV
jgi:hypothetical protein